MAEHLTTDSPNAVIADQGLIYCRFPSGEIQAVDASPMELMKKINRGIMPLGDYGQFGSSAYYMDHPFEPLFQAGGAREMSTEQIVSLGYHLRPPMVPTCDQHVGASKEHLAHLGTPGASSAKGQGCWRGAHPVQFPQLAGKDLPPEPEPCEFCDRDDFPTEAARAQHQDVMHADRRQQNALGEAIVGGLVKSGMVSSGSGADAIAAAVAATLQALGYGAPKARPAAAPDDEDEDEKPEQSEKIAMRNARRNAKRRAATAAARSAALTPS